MLYGLKIGEFNIFHEGNHNDVGNPHPQYSLPILRIKQPSIAGQYTKIISTEPIKNEYRCHFFLKGQIISYYDSGKNNGEITINITKKYDGTFKAESFFENENIDFPAMFYAYKRDVDSNQYAIDIYLQANISNESLKFIPLLCDFSFNKDWDAFQNRYVQRSHINFFENQPFTNVVNGTLLCISQPRKMPLKSITSYTIQITSGSVIDCTNLATALLNFSTPTTVNDLINFQEGQIVTLHAVAPNATIENNNKIKLKGGQNATLPVGGNITLRRIQSLWCEIARNF